MYQLLSLFGGGIPERPKDILHLCTSTELNDEISEFCFTFLASWLLLNRLCKFVTFMGLPFSLDAGEGKFCMWLVNNVEIDFEKVGFIDSKWSYLNAPKSYTPWCHSLLGSTFSLDAGKIGAKFFDRIAL